MYIHNEHTVKLAPQVQYVILKVACDVSVHGPAKVHPLTVIIQTNKKYEKAHKV